MSMPTNEAKAKRRNPHFRLDLYEPEADLMILNFGPQHPSTHEIGRASCRERV